MKSSINGEKRVGVERTGVGSEHIERQTGKQINGFIRKTTATKTKTKRPLTFIGVRFYFFWSEDMSVNEELSHELVSVVDPQISVVIERVAIIARFGHDVLYAIHELGPNLRQLLHVLHVGLMRMNE